MYISYLKKNIHMHKLTKLFQKSRILLFSKLFYFPLFFCIEIKTINIIVMYLLLHLLFITSKHNVVHVQNAPNQALKSWQEHVHLEGNIYKKTVTNIYPFLYEYKY